MITCPMDNCGAENEDGAKFCECCGTPLPQDKECPSCHNRVKLTAKFCAECGFNFNKQQVADKSGSMLSMGDKNVIAGDVVGKQENIKISGSATIIKNEDESKKVVTCHVCGKNLFVSEAVKCTDCGEITCSKCIDAKLNVCKNCASRIISNNEDVYKQALIRFLEDGKIEMSERNELNALRNQLGIEDQKAAELERMVRRVASINSSSTASNLFEAVSPFDMEYYRKAEWLFYEDFNYLETLELTEDLYQKYPRNENILTLHLNALAVSDREKAIELINNLEFDILGAVLVDIDISLAINTKNSIGKAGEKLTKAIPLWPDSVLLKCRQIIYLLKIARLLNNERFLSEADGIFDSIGEEKNKLERSWIFKAKLALSQYRGDKVPEITEEYCKEHDFYRSVLVDINEEKGRKFYEQAREILENNLFHKKGFALLLKSAELNYLPAIREIGIAYYNAKYSVKKDIAKAIVFFQKGAEQNDPKCQLELGRCLIEKEDISKEDISEGLKWVRRAVSQGFAQAEFVYSMLYGNRDEFKDNKGNFVILLEKDLQKSMKFLQKASNHDYGPAQFYLGMAYSTGKLWDVDDFCEKDANVALMWLEKATEKQHDLQADAMFELGEIYDADKIVPRDEAKAKHWYEQAAKAGHSAAKRKLESFEDKKNIAGDNKILEKAISDEKENESNNQLYVLSEEGSADKKQFSEAGHSAAKRKLESLEDKKNIAGKKATRQEVIEEAVAYFFRKLSPSEDIYLSPAIPAEKEINLRKNSNIPKQERVYAVIDCSSFGTAQHGMAFTRQGMRGHNDGSGPFFCSWENFIKYDKELIVDEYDICIASGVSLDVEFCCNEEGVLDMLKNLKQHIKQTISNTSFDMPKEQAKQGSEKAQESNKKATRQEVIEEAVADFFSNLSPSESLYLSPAIPAEKEKNLRKKAHIPSQESVYALIDCTGWGSAKDGMAFTRKGMWIHNDWASKKSGPIFCSWENFIKYDKELIIDGYEIRIDLGIFLNVSGCHNQEGVLDMLKNLKQHIKQTISNTSFDMPKEQAKQSSEKAQETANAKTADEKENESNNQLYILSEEGSADKKQFSEAGHSAAKRKLESLEDKKNIAGKKAKRQEVIEEAVADFFSNLSPSEDIYLSPAIPAGKEKNLRKKANIPNQESVYALIDCTVFGSAKNGMAFTRKGMWGHNEWGGPFFCSWENFIKYDKELIVDKYDICIASGVALNVAASNKEGVLDMLKNLKQHIKQTISNTSFNMPKEQAKQGSEKAQETAVAKTATNFSSNTVDLILDNCGTNIDEVRKKICEIFQIEYSDAKEYTDIAPVYLCQEISLSDAEYVKQNLEAVGAVLRIELSKKE